jgi:RNA polymerase sigma-70 factor (ECF subfamily)
MGFDGSARSLSLTLDRDTGAIAEQHLDRADLSEQTRWMLAVRDTGDRAAFARLFDHFAPRVKAMAMRSGATAALAEEIAQDSMLRVWRSAAQFDPTRAQVSGWVYQIARNRQIDLARRAPRAVLDEVEASWTEAEVGSALALEQEAAQLRLALAALPPEQRDLVEKAYLGELTHQEISRATMLPLGTVKSRLRLALERLRHELRGLRK